MTSNERSEMNTTRQLHFGLDRETLERDYDALNSAEMLSMADYHRLGRLARILDRCPSCGSHRDLCEGH